MDSKCSCLPQYDMQFHDMQFMTKNPTIIDRSTLNGGDMVAWYDCFDIIEHHKFDSFPPTGVNLSLKNPGQPA